MGMEAVVRKFYTAEITSIAKNVLIRLLVVSIRELIAILGRVKDWASGSTAYSVFEDERRWSISFEENRSISDTATNTKSG